MSPWLQHLPVVPVVAPLFAGAAMLLVPESRRRRAAIAIAAVLVQLAVAIVLLYLTTDAVPDIWSKGIGVYSIGAWPAPFGIVLVVDRLSALMLVLAATVALPALIYSLARWDRVGVHFHPLFQFLLMGMNGAFLTGDLFNLFVFVEVLLAASYGLILHGSGAARVKAGLHYIAVNLVASVLFLIGVALIYGVAGTLNLADLGPKATALAPGDRGLFDIGATILGIAFLIKAASWPLNFWLPAAYAAAGAPVAAVFSMLTKVGIYAVIRVGSLLTESGVHGPFGSDWLFYGGIATVVFGTVGMLAAQQLGRLVAFSVVVSSGTLLAAIGLDAAALTASALFYLVSSVLASGAFFLLTGMTERARTNIAESTDAAPMPPVTYGAFGMEDSHDPMDVEDEVGVAIPAAMAFLGLNFVFCVLLVAGLPPLSGFVAKFALLSSAVSLAPSAALPAQSWAFVAAMLATGLAAIIALTRVGMRLFWSVIGRNTPRLRVIEAAPVAFLVVLCIVLSVAADPVMSFLDAAAQGLSAPQAYIDAVLSVAAREPARMEVVP
jgi:multicomponent K+:H+ antiporter subunit D